MLTGRNEHLESIAGEALLSRVRPANPTQSAQTEQTNTRLIELTQMFQALGQDITILALPVGPEADRALARRLHDFRGALRTFRLALDALQNGYRFDDDKRDAKISALQKALAALTAEEPLVTTLLRRDAAVSSTVP